MSATGTHEALGAILNRRPEVAPLLNRLGLDYCTWGTRPLAGVVRDAELDLSEVIALIDSTPPAPVPGWVGLEPGELADHLEATHHAYLREALPRIEGLLAEVSAGEGDDRPELAEIRGILAELREDVEPHLQSEEESIFPLIRAVAAGDPGEGSCCGSVGNAAGCMGADHQATLEILSRLSERTGSFTAPGDASPPLRRLWEQLGELDADLRLHMHKENNVLFPAALDAERRLADREPA